MFRDRTNLFIAYRRTFPHEGEYADDGSNDAFNRGPEEEQGLVGEGDNFAHYKDNEPNLEMQQLPPSMLKLEEESDAMLEGIERDIKQLGQLYKKNMLPGFSDTSKDEEAINEMSSRITRKFQFMYSQIRKLDDEKMLFGRKSETLLVDNLKKKLALRVQDLSTGFRKLQNNYIRYLRRDEMDEDRINTGKVEDESNEIEDYSRQAMQSSSMQLQQNQVSDQYLQQREREIYKIAQGVVEISTLFKELENMVIDQGTVLDRIDYNITQTVIHTKKADKQMRRAEGYQKATTKCKVVFFLVLLILLLIMLLMMKPRRVDHYYHGDKGKGDDTGTNKGDDTDNNNDDANKGEITTDNLLI